MTEPSNAGPGEPDTTPTQSAVAAPRAPSPTSVWGRLKEHKVVQWTLAYAAAAYTLLHGTEMLSDAQEWPHVIVRVLSLALILGVPVVMTLAWYHGAKGLRRISGPELTIITILLVIAGIVLWALTRMSGEHAAPTATAAIAAAPVTAAPATPAAPRTSIAVMPFANLTGDATKDYLGDGMAEQLINTLSKVPGLRIPARTSTFSYKGRNTDAKQIARDLDVGTILEGSVRSAGTTIRITAELIDAQNDSHLWSESYDRKFTDLFKLQDDLATAIVQALKVNLNGAGPASVAQAPPTRDVQAYGLYLQGEALIERTSPQNLTRAVGYFQQALARDPVFARAYSGLSIAYVLFFHFGQEPIENLAAAERAAQRALTLDATLSEAQVTLASVAAARGNPLEAEASFHTALSLSPDDAQVLGNYGSFLREIGRLHAALDEVNKAHGLAPANAGVLNQEAVTYSALGHDAEALQFAQLAVDLGTPETNIFLSNVHERAALDSGRYAEAAAAALSGVNLNDPNQARIAEVMKLVYGALADPSQKAIALAARSRLYPTSSRSGSSPSAATDLWCLRSSVAFTLLGELNVAYEMANQCVDSPAPGAPLPYSTYLWVPEARPFRRDQRFQVLVTRLGLMEYYRQYGAPDDCDLKDGKLTCH
jgi:TolB-like protein/Flp pilus assembly protein TadD